MINTLGDAMGLSMSPMRFSSKFGYGGQNEPQFSDVPLLGNKNQTLHQISIGRGDACPQSVRGDDWDKNECSGRGIMSMN